MQVQSMASHRANTTRGDFVHEDLFSDEEDDEDEDDDLDNVSRGPIVNRIDHEDRLNDTKHTCHLSNKASQTCFCRQNKLNLIDGERLVSAAPDSTGHLDDLPEEDERESVINVEAEPATRYEQIDQNTQPAPPQPNPRDQVRVLRDLLRLERANSDKWQRNNVALQNYVQQLQMDFLRQQRELVEALEFGNKLKTQKDSQISIVEATIIEKDRLIVQLRSQLEDLDEAKLRSEFKVTLEKQQQMASMQEEQLRLQIEQKEQQLAREKANSMQSLAQYQAKLDDQMRLHEQELASIRSRHSQVQAELERLLGEPQNLLIKSLRGDNAELNSRLDELNLVLNDSQTKYDSLKRKLEHLLAEQVQTESKSQEDADELQKVLTEQRQHINELKLELEDKQEIIQILQFNLQRSEKRVKNLIGVLKSKEETYRQMTADIESKNSLDIEKLQTELNSLQKQLTESASELVKKQNELVRLRLERDNQLESLRNDRDERLNKCSMDKQKIERDLRSVEMHLAREAELASSKAKQIDQLQKDVTQFRDESKRLLIELANKEAKLHSKQKEFDELLVRHKDPRGCHEQEEGVENNETQLERLNLELNEEKLHSTRYKNQLDNLRKDHEKMCIKLRIAEANLIKMTSSINREHSRMLLDYEKKIELIRSEQVNFDRNKLRYKRYSCKLKKYCEHLRKVHDHICNPNNCSYLIYDFKSQEGE